MKKCPFSSISDALPRSGNNNDTRLTLHTLATRIIANIWSVLSTKTMTYPHIPKEDFYKNFNLQTIQYINTVREESMKNLDIQGQNNVMEYSTRMNQVLGENGLMLPSFTDLITFMSAFAQGLESLHAPATLTSDDMKSILAHPKTFGMVVSLMDRSRDYTLTLMEVITDENFLASYQDDYIFIQPTALIMQTDTHGDYLSLNESFLIRGRAPLGGLLVLLNEKFPKGPAKCPALSTGNFRDMYVWMIDYLIKQRFTSI